ncbi:MAG TPA: hypothetical protein VGC77_14560 [Rhodopseudomonas sp.]|uniref:hypothetical protein n=1 Tax=Rhodopseudomonas sp. TaxID=1078 RepID=UPI002ED834EA
MNALQIVPPPPATKFRRSALRFRVSDVILLLALAGGISMSRGEERPVPESGAAAVMEDTPDKIGSSDKSPSVTPLAAASVGPTTEGGSAGDEKASASARPMESSALAAPAGVRDDPEIGAEAGEPIAAQARSDTAASAAIKDRNLPNLESSRILANQSAVPSASISSKRGFVPGSEGARGPKRVSNAISARPESARQSHRSMDYSSWRPADGRPVRGSPSSIIYGPSQASRTAPRIVPAEGISRERAMPVASMTGIWERVVDAPSVVLNGGKYALYGIIDSVW